MTTRRGFLGWPGRSWALLGVWVGLLAATTAALLLTRGAGEPTFSLVARIGARSALVAFALAFSARPLHECLPSRVTRTLLTWRRELGVCFAASHLWFLGANVSRVILHHGGDPFSLRPPSAWIVGGGGYVFIVAMAITSFPRPAAALGPRRWKLLHTVGGWAILLGFLNSYGLRAIFAEGYLPHAALVLAVLGLRVCDLCRAVMARRVAS